MFDWIHNLPILSIVTYLPLVGALLIMTGRQRRWMARGPC